MCFRELVVVIEKKHVLGTLGVGKPSFGGPRNANDVGDVGVCKSRSARNGPRCSQSSCKLSGVRESRDFQVVRDVVDVLSHFASDGVCRQLVALRWIDRVVAEIFRFGLADDSLCSIALGV